MTSILSGGLASALLIWLLRTWISERLKSAIQNEYEQKLETHKAKLKYQSELEIERLRSQLHIQAERHNIRFAKIYGEIAETVASTYEKLIKFKKAVADYVSIIEWSGDPPKEERRKIVDEKMKQFIEFYEYRKLYLPRGTVNRIDRFWQGLYEISIDFMYAVEQGKGKSLPDEKDTWKKAHDFISKEIPPLLADLEYDFRNILGTNIDDSDAEHAAVAHR